MAKAIVDLQVEGNAQQSALEARVAELRAELGAAERTAKDLTAEARNFPPHPPPPAPTSDLDPHPHPDIESPAPTPAPAPALSPTPALSRRPSLRAVFQARRAQAELEEREAQLALERGEKKRNITT